MTKNKMTIVKWFQNTTFAIFLSKKRREFINDIVLGSYLGIKTFEFTAHLEFWGLKHYLHPILSVLVGLIIFLVDFYLFHREGNRIIQKDINELNKSMQHLIEQNNKIAIELAKGAILRENEIMQKIIKNNLTLPSLQNFEYVRKNYARILNDVMKQDDHYITLSNIDFWTMSPKETLSEFINIHKKAVQEENKNVHRIVVLNKDKFYLKNGVNPDKDEHKKVLEQKRETFGNLLKAFDENFSLTLKGSTYFDKFKFLCYLVNSEQKEKLDQYLASVIVVNSNFKDILLVYATQIDNVESHSPIIYFKHFSLEIEIDETDKQQVIKILKGICNAIEKKTQILSKKKMHLSEEELILKRYTKTYLDLFNDLGNLYNLTTGNRNDDFDVQKIKMYDIPLMLSTHY